MNTSAPHPLRSRILQWGGSALEFALNRVLALDSDTQQALHRLNGRSIDLRLDAPVLAARLRVKNGRLFVGPTDEAESDLSLSATAGALLARLLPSQTSNATPGKLRISGDIDLAQQVQKLAQQFAPDLEEALSQRLGDVLGVQVARALRSAGQTAQQIGKTSVTRVVEYVRDERGDVLGSEEMNAFLDEVDQLRDRAERLAQRVEQFKRQVDGRYPSSD
ncbi:MAG: SCP2 sterol-binding domain-containing protein [Xanthomonadales bacterium]|nr:SCP2 sterol-binding domain-containing protein [Xanthomonadales bacterium]